MIKKIIAIILLNITMLTGCTNSTFDKSMEEGKLALASKEYEKASGLFGLALEEKSNDKEAKSLKEGTEKIISINKLNSEGNLEEAINLCDEIKNSNIGSGIILKELENLKKELKDQLDNINDKKEKIKLKIKEAEDLISNKKYTQAKELLNELIIEVKENDAYGELLNKINLLIEDCNTNISKNESDKNLTAQIAMEILYQKVSVDLDYELISDIDSSYHIYGETINNFYCFSPSENGTILEGLYYVHKTTGKVYEQTSDGSINEI